MHMPKGNCVYVLFRLASAWLVGTRGSSANSLDINHLCKEPAPLPPLRLLCGQGRAVWKPGLHAGCLDELCPALDKQGQLQLARLDEWLPGTKMRASAQRGSSGDPG